MSRLWRHSPRTHAALTLDFCYSYPLSPPPAPCACNDAIQTGCPSTRFAGWPTMHWPTRRWAHEPALRSARQLRRGGWYHILQCLQRVRKSGHLKRLNYRKDEQVCEEILAREHVKKLLVKTRSVAVDGKTCCLDKYNPKQLFAKKRTARRSLRGWRCALLLH